MATMAAAAVHASQPHCLPFSTTLCTAPNSHLIRNHGHGQRQPAVSCLQRTPEHSRQRQRQQQKPGLTLTIPRALSHILHLNREAHNEHPDSFFPLHQHPKSTPTSSPKEDISSMWRELQGSRGWAALLDPLHPWLRREVVKYGEFAQATYDAFDADRSSRYCGSCRFGRPRLLRQLGLAHTGYEVTSYIYAMSHVELPRWLERSLHAETWSRDSNWMGYVAVSGDEETRRIGRRDIVVAWRGTVTPAEWFEDAQRRLEPLHGHGPEEHHQHHHHQNDVAKVEHGFHSIYTSKSESTRYNKTSASEQVVAEIRRLVKLYSDRGEEVSLTITGHSLGGALALLNAHDAAAAAIPGLAHVSVVSFGAPRVGNAAFGRELDELGVKVLRLVNKQDLVPRLPGAIFNEDLGRFVPLEGLDWVYAHAGVEMEVDVRASPYLKHGSFDVAGFHSLETYMHLVDGFLSRVAAFRREARRDVALVNKACGLLLEELKIPACWYQVANKGLVCNAHGRWVATEREPEDVPSPYREMAPLLLSPN